MLLNSQIIVKSYSKIALVLYLNYLKTLLSKGGIFFSSFSFPMKRKRITLLKSPHVNKKSKEQFEIKSFKTVLFLNNSLSLDTVKNITMNRPKCVSLTVKV